MMEKIPEGATHRIVYHIKDPRTYTYYRKHKKHGHWQYLSHEFNDWRPSRHDKEWFQENLEPIDRTR